MPDKSSFPDKMLSTTYTIRELQIKDILPLHKTYDSLSEETKHFFHPGFLGLKTISFLWFLAQVGLIASSIKTLRKLLSRIFPFPVFLSIVAVNEQNEIIGFAYLKVKNLLPSRNLSANLGMIVVDNYQDRGVGSGLMKALLRLAKKENIMEITLKVLPNNMRAIRLYKKYGFKYI